LTSLLDTDVAIDVLDGEPYALHLFRTLTSDIIQLSMISYFEIQDGVLGSRNRALREQEFARLLRLVVLRELDRPIADVAADIRQSLRKQKRAVKHRSLDILIAATAIVHNAVLVTRNLKDYGDIPGIQLYSWPIEER
jgi:predicted nucleic acid-binding protein